jgi:SUMO ligase MMS21 Smc5/6 complex component
MDVADMITGIKKNLEDLKLNFKLTTERCFFASKEVI